MKNNFYNKSFVTVEHLSKNDVLSFFEKTYVMKKLIEEKQFKESLKGQVMTALFYEPSTRTFSSFVSAMQRLGGGFIPNRDISSTSVVKGETLEDTVQVLSRFCEVIVLRHPEKGSMENATKASSVPIINAGDGIGEHPSQALQDLFTIQEKLGTIDNLHITMLGDLGHYRPVNSLAKLLTLFKGVMIDFVSPKEVSIQSELRNVLEKRNCEFNEYEALDEVIEDTDVLYVTRVKKEYMPQALYNKIQGSFVVDDAVLAKMKKESIIMHPLPRVGEITLEVDSDPRAVYLSDQLRNGLYTKMALLESILTK